MTVYEVMEHLGGAILNNKARVMFEGSNIVIGVFEGADLVMTEEGRRVEAVVSNELAGKATKIRRTKAAAVESAEPQPDV